MKPLREAILSEAVLREALFNKKNLNSFKGVKRYEQFLKRPMSELFDYIKENGTKDYILTKSFNKSEGNDVQLLLPNDFNEVEEFIQELSESEDFSLDEELYSIENGEIRKILKHQNCFSFYFRDMNLQYGDRILINYDLYNYGSGVDKYYEYSEIEEIEIIDDIFDFDYLKEHIENYLE